MLNIAILGFGTVGSGVYEVIKENGNEINAKLGKKINIKYILDLRDFPGSPAKNLITHEFSDILNDDDVKIVVEVMGGLLPSYSFTKACLAAGKHVVTSNKALVAEYGAELLEAAGNNNVNFLFEASVGGGIPIIRPLNTSFTSERILEITGILNGTTNYILTEMSENGSDFNDALKKAQKLGFAESDPTEDIEGCDACRKIAILSSLAFGKNVSYKDIYTEGISNITSVDFKYAKSLNSKIKLLAASKRSGAGVYAKVTPVIIPDSHPLSSVNGVYNAVFVKGNMLGETMFYGKGAGSLPTASAVVSDVIHAARHISVTCKAIWPKERLEILDLAHTPVSALIRIASDDKKEAGNIAKKVLNCERIVDLGEEYSEFAVVCLNETETGIKEKIEKLKSFDIIKEVCNLIRMEG